MPDPPIPAGIRLEGVGSGSISRTSMEERYAIVEVFVTEDSSEFSEIRKTQAIIDMYRIESFYATLDGHTILAMYSGDTYHVDMSFQDFERYWREYAGGKVQLFQ